MEAEEGSLMEKTCGGGEDLCAYEKGDKGEKTPVGCDETSSLKKAGVCMTNSEGQRCFCDTNFCNSANSIRASKTFLPLFVLIAFYALRLAH